MLGSGKPYDVFKWKPPASLSPWEESWEVWTLKRSGRWANKQTDGWQFHPRVSARVCVHTLLQLSLLTRIWTDLMKGLQDNSETNWLPGKKRVIGFFLKKSHHQVIAWETYKADICPFSNLHSAWKQGCTFLLKHHLIFFFKFVADNHHSFLSKSDTLKLLLSLICKLMFIHACLPRLNATNTTANWFSFPLFLGSLK